MSNREFFHHPVISKLLLATADIAMALGFSSHTSSEPEDTEMDCSLTKDVLGVTVTLQGSYTDPVEVQENTHLRSNNLKYFYF